ncbi:hypothetical protein D1007_04991 [Hordeum vulgare]|nr:hypothetical protein D1007_04991 [Hordeum vulgare]
MEGAIQGEVDAKCFKKTVRCSLKAVKVRKYFLQPRHKARVVKSGFGCVFDLMIDSNISRPLMGHIYNKIDPSTMILDMGEFNKKLCIASDAIHHLFGFLQGDCTPPRPSEDGFDDAVMRVKAKLGYKGSDDIKTKDLRNIVKHLVKDEKNDHLALHVFYLILFKKVVIPGVLAVKVFLQLYPPRMFPMVLPMKYLEVVDDALRDNIILPESATAPLQDPGHASDLLLLGLMRMFPRSKIMFRNNECEAMVEDVASPFGLRGMPRYNVAEANILSRQFNGRVRNFFNASGPESMDDHDYVIFPTFDPHDVPAHMGGVGHWVSIFLDLKNGSIDYGFFMLTNVNLFHEGVLTNYTHEDMSNIRKTWMYAIASSNLFEIDFMDLFGYHAFFLPFFKRIEKVGHYIVYVLNRYHGSIILDSLPYSKKGISQTRFHEDCTHICSCHVLPFKRFVGLLEELYGKAEYKASNQPNWLFIGKRPSYVDVPKQCANEYGFFCMKFCFTYDVDDLTKDFSDVDFPAVDDWKAEYMYNLVFNPNNEILHEVLPVEIRELAE